LNQTFFFLDFSSSSFFSQLNGEMQLHVEGAGNLEDARRMMIEDAYDVVMIDITLPDNQALETAVAIRDLNAKRILGKECAIFLLRGDNDPPYDERPEFDGVITRPLVKEAVEERLKQWAQKQTAGQE